MCQIRFDVLIVLKETVPVSKQPQICRKLAGYQRFEAIFFDKVFLSIEEGCYLTVIWYKIFQKTTNFNATFAPI